MNAPQSETVHFVVIGFQTEASAKEAMKEITELTGLQGKVTASTDPRSKPNPTTNENRNG